MSKRIRGQDADFLSLLYKPKQLLKQLKGSDEYKQKTILELLKIRARIDNDDYITYKTNVRKLSDFAGIQEKDLKKIYKNGQSFAKRNKDYAGQMKSIINSSQEEEEAPPPKKTKVGEDVNFAPLRPVGENVDPTRPPPTKRRREEGDEGDQEPPTADGHSIFEEIHEMMLNDKSSLTDYVEEQVAKAVAEKVKKAVEEMTKKTKQKRQERTDKLKEIRKARREMENKTVIEDAEPPKETAQTEQTEKDPLMNLPPLPPSPELTSYEEMAQEEEGLAPFEEAGFQQGNTYDEAVQEEQGEEKEEEQGQEEEKEETTEQLMGADDFVEEEEAYEEPNVIVDTAEPDVGSLVAQDGEVDQEETADVQGDGEGMQMDAEEVQAAEPSGDTLEHAIEQNDQVEEEIAENKIQEIHDDPEPVADGQTLQEPNQPIVDEEGDVGEEEAVSEMGQQEVLEERDQQVMDYEEFPQSIQAIFHQNVQHQEVLNYIDVSYGEVPAESKSNEDERMTDRPILEEEKTQTREVEMETRLYQDRQAQERHIATSEIEEKAGQALDLLYDSQEAANVIMHYDHKDSTKVLSARPGLLYDITIGKALRPMQNQCHQDAILQEKREKEYRKATKVQRKNLEEKMKQEAATALKNMNELVAQARMMRDLEQVNAQNQIEYEKRKSMFTRANANKALVYPSVCDPNAYNAIEYLKDENGNYLMDPSTGGPIMSSMSAVTRDEASNLAEQNKVAKGMLFKKPFYPYFGKACKDFFSNQEFSLLARYLDDKGNVHKEVVMKSDQGCRVEAKELYEKMKYSLRLGPFPETYNMRKLLIELRLLNESYGTYTSITEYDYPNALKNNEDKEGLQKDVESALDSFKRITMAQLLEQISKSKKELEKDFAMNQHMFDVDTQKAEEKTKQAYPEIDPQGNRGMQQGDNSEFRGLINPAAPRAAPRDSLSNYRNNTRLYPWPLGDRADELREPEDEASSGVWV